MSERRVWIVSELYYPELSGTGHFITGIAEGLAQRFKTGVICSQPTPRVERTTAPRHEVHNGVEIWRCSGTRFSHLSLLGKLINLVTISLSLFFAARKHFRPGDTVIVGTNPPMAFVLIAAAARVRGCRCVLLTYDVFPDALWVTGLASRGNPLVRLMEWAARRTYRRLDVVVVIGRDMQKQMRASVPSSIPIEIVENWGDTEEVRPIARDQSQLLTELGLKEKFVVQYAGTMGHSHDLGTLLEAARLLREQHKIHFLLVGSGVEFAKLQRETKVRPLSNVTLMDAVPRSQMADMLSACDASVISFKPGMAGISVPSRMYNVMASGRPLIAVSDLDSELAMVVGENRIGWIVSPGNAQQLATAIADAARNPSLRDDMGRRARALVEANYTKSASIEKLTRVLEGIAGSSSA